jgi:hypothetical protein
MPNTSHSRFSVANLAHTSSIRINPTTKVYIIGREVTSRTLVGPKTRPREIQMLHASTVVKLGSAGICGFLPPGTP